MSNIQHSWLLLANVAGAFGARFVNLFTAFLTVPLAVAGLGTHDYGIFAVILSAATFVTYADFGMGLAMVNPITVSEARGDAAETRRLISETWGLLHLIAALIFGVGAVLVAANAWHGGRSLAELAPWLVFVVGVAIGLPAAIAQRVLFALQRSYEANLWMAAARVASLGCVYLAYQLGAGLWLYVFAMLCVPAVVGWVNAFWLFRVSRPDLAPHGGASLTTAARLIPEGLRYTVLQIGPYVETGFDIVLIGALIGTSMTTSYDLLTRAFNYVPALATIGVLPLWPSIAAARTRGAVAWARRVEIIATVLLCGGAAVAVTGIALYHREIVHLWTGQTIAFETPLIALIACSAALSSVAALLGSILVGHQKTRSVFLVQVVVVVALTLAKVGVIVPFGILAVAAANVIALLAKTTWFLALLGAETASRRRDV
ncbi:lipopolysaccharide biosynthesis protein [Rhizobium sp. SGZ-381]|uniref:lipopolysaccharide biosynthesis protein n=1 Tax=Rhizobium sp. SGZ-381 TaxID=3342800 RepID=UPI0036713845